MFTFPKTQKLLVVRIVPDDRQQSATRWSSQAWQCHTQSCCWSSAICCCVFIMWTHLLITCSRQTFSFWWEAAQLCCCTHTYVNFGWSKGASSSCRWKLFLVVKGEVWKNSGGFKYSTYQLQRDMHIVFCCKGWRGSRVEVWCPAVKAFLMIMLVTVGSKRKSVFTQNWNWSQGSALCIFTLLKQWSWETVKCSGHSFCPGTFQKLFKRELYSVFWISRPATCNSLCITEWQARTKHALVL